MAKPIVVPTSAPFILRDIAARWARPVVVINPVSSGLLHLIDGVKIRDCSHEDTPFAIGTARTKGRLDLERLLSEDSLVARHSPADDHTKLAGLTREGWSDPSRITSHVGSVTPVQLGVDSVQFPVAMGLISRAIIPSEELAERARNQPAYFSPAVARVPVRWIHESGGVTMDKMEAVKRFNRLGWLERQARKYQRFNNPVRVRRVTNLIMGVELAFRETAPYMEMEVSPYDRT